MRYINSTRRHLRAQIDSLRLKNRALEVEIEALRHLSTQTDYLRLENRALEVEIEALRDLLYEIGITDPNPLDLSLGAIQDIHRALGKGAES